MRAQVVRRTALMALVVCALAPPTWAAAVPISGPIQHRGGTLNGVDPSGNPNSGLSLSTTFLCLVNTFSGDTVALGNANVVNRSNRLQIYFNNSAFGSINGVAVSHSLYLVGPFGFGSLLATGSIEI